MLLNFVLKSILQLLVEFEKHWTQSDKVRGVVVVCTKFVQHHKSHVKPDRFLLCARVSTSMQERAYAVLAFVSQLLNSVLVLLLVNAQSSIASAVINGALNRGTASRYTSW